MKIAFVNAFPVAEFTAEKEFIRRCVGVLGRQGHDAREVADSDAVTRFGPDVVFATHEFVPKLTEHFTVGPLWSPTSYYKDEPDRLRAIRSWDMVVPINAATRQFARDLHFPSRHRSAVAEAVLYPSAPVVEIAAPDPARLSLAYVGVHWDGSRHEALFRALAARIELHVYGPPKAWEFLPEAYRGQIPFDGHSLIDTLNRHGAVLALHKPTHHAEDTPSMRVFEACAAGCLVFTDPMPSLAGLFGDSLEYLPAGADAEATAAAIVAGLEAARAAPEATARRMEQARQVFRGTASLDVLLPRLLAEVERGRAAAARLPSLKGDEAAASPVVSVIIRCGSRPLPLLARAVASLERQHYPGIALVFARFAPIEGFDAYVAALRAGNRFHAIQVIEVGSDGSRSASLWAGLAAVATPFFALLDDDDEVFPDHLLHLMAEFARCPDADVVHAGGIRHEEEGALPEPHPRLRRPDGTAHPESRELAFLDPFDLERLLTWNNMILSHAFVARTALLTEDVLDDPALAVSEDVYLYMLLAARGARFRFNGRVSVIWNWRSRTSDNSMLSVDLEQRLRIGERIVRRLGGHVFPGGYLGERVIGRGFAPRQPENVLEAEAEAYHATPEEGIDFRRPGLPNFVAEASGFSFPEGWGRWTDGEEARIRFQQPLPERFELELTGRPADSLFRRKVSVTIGGVRQAIRLRRLEQSTYRLRVLNPQAADTITIALPEVVSPAEALGDPAADTRRLGFALARLRVRPHRAWWPRVVAGLRRRLGRYRALVRG